MAAFESRKPGGKQSRLEGPSHQWSDLRLIDACRGGDERAWFALIDKYKRLIYSVAIKYGLTPDDAADVFQNVCVELFSDLDRLRKVDSLKAWLIRVTLNRCYHWKKQQRARGTIALEEMAHEPEEDALATPEFLEQVEKEQIVREAIRDLPERCGEMVRLLFFEEPPLPYADVAQRLGLATGSIGFIRGRCLKRLEKALLALGF
jgi:RNA polymerase sigma factor (sigma-70 family)